jgi:hypothetical protein
MRTFQLSFRNGETQRLEVSGYSKGRRGLVMMTPDGGTFRIPAKDLIKVEEISDSPTSGRPPLISVARPRMTGGKERRSKAA